jgi:hypothetical protein
MEMPDSSGDHRSRYAELAMELIGSKMATQMIEQVWAEASPEVRGRLASAVLEKLEEHIRSDRDFHVHDQVAGLVSAFVRERVAAEAPRLREMISEDFGDMVMMVLRTVVSQGAKTFVERHIHEIAQKLIAAMTVAMRNI